MRAKDARGSSAECACNEDGDDDEPQRSIPEETEQRATALGEERRAGLRKRHRGVVSLRSNSTRPYDDVRRFRRGTDSAGFNATS